MKAAILNLRSIHASDLHNCCSNPLDKQDPFVQICVGSKRVETARKTDAGIDALFDDEFDIILKEDLDKVEFKVEVFHKNALGFKTHLGAGSKRLLDLIPSYDEQITFVIELYNNTKKMHKGQVKITGYLSSQDSPSRITIQQSIAAAEDTSSSQVDTKQAFEVSKDSTLYSKFDAFKIDELVQIMNNYNSPEQIIDAILTSPVLIQTKYVYETSDSSALIENKPHNDEIAQGGNEGIQNDRPPTSTTTSITSTTENSNQNEAKVIKMSDFSSFVDPLMIYNETKPKDISKYNSGRSKSVVDMVDYNDAPKPDDDIKDHYDDEGDVDTKPPEKPPEKVEEKKFPKILKKVLDVNRQQRNEGVVGNANSRKSEFLDAVYLQMLSSKKPPTETPTKSKLLEKYRRPSGNMVRHDDMDHDDTLDI